MGTNIIEFDKRTQLYKQHRLKGMGIYQAAKEAGYSESYARSKAWRIETRVRRDMKQVFARKGLTDDRLAEHAMEGLNAMKVISCNVIANDGEGMKDANSMTKDFVDVPDWPTRHKYFDSICAMTNRVADKIAGSVNLNEYKIIIIRAEIPSEIKTTGNVLFERPLRTESTLIENPA